FLQRWFGGLDPTRLGLLLGAAAILSVGLLALFLLKPWQGRDDLRSRQLRRFERLLEMHGLRRSPGEGLRSYGERAARVLPAQAPAIAAFVGAFEAQRYGHGGADDPGLRLRALRRALPWRLVRTPTRDGRGEGQ
ncbi:DUF3488 domain-containing protein, partial [Pseudomonas aeruginosa]